MKNIDLKLVEKLADKMNENSLNEISIEKGDEKITLKREIKGQPVTQVQNTVVKKSAPVAKVAHTNKEKEIIKGNIIVAPTVGTFYSSPAPGEAPFVMMGDKVEPGKTVCIIEAMKMMNEVTSNFNGKIVKIFVEDGTVVQKGDQLFVVE
ncbi:MAG: biotin/lipoyl-containing protein [Fusobacterium sp. JB021]|nr:biotin/lipoyl-containing protein [Fusobacterium sp. JB021]